MFRWLKKSTAVRYMNPPYYKFQFILTVYGQPFVEILSVGQDDRLPEIARALMVGGVI
jgi:hypothetical protein